MVERFHQELTQVDGLKVKNEALKEELDNLRKESATKAKEYYTSLKEERKDGEERLSRIIDQYEKNATSERINFTEALEAKDKELADAKKEMHDMKKQKERDLENMSIEYEDKLVKIQRQKVHVLQTSHQAGNQDIFRKKLQHIKEAHEEEIANLKKQIQVLKTRVVQDDCTSNQAMQSCFQRLGTKRKERCQ